MANFTRRMLAFFLGMIFSFVLVVGGIVGGGYWAFKNLSLKDVGVEEDTLGELSSLTFEEWASFMVEIKKDPQGLTVKELEKKGLSVDSILKLLKVDPEKVDEKDLNSFRDLAIGALFSGDGMYEVNMGVIFMFLPKDAETGKYPIFSEGARNRLRQYTLGDLLAKDSQNAGFSSVLRSMKIGSVLSSVYEETIDGGDYVYTAEDMGLNLLANLEMGVLTDMSEGTQMDLGYEVKEGYLSSLAGKEIAEIIASFGAKTEDAFKEKYEGLSLVSGVLLGDLFIFDEELDAYALTIDPLFNLLSVGKLMGVTLCTKTESCPVHEDVADCDGELYEGDTVSTKPALEKVLLTNLASLNVVDMLGGLDIAVLLEGMYFGLAMGNSQCNNTEKCPVHGTEDCGENAGKWYDGDGHELGKLFGDISSYTMVDALEGHFDIEGILNDCNIGQVFNYYKVGDVWYDNTDQPIGKETVSEKIMYELYDKKISDFSSLEVSDLMKGITLGEFLNLTYDSVNDVWLNSSNEEVSVLYGSIAGLTVTELMNNSNALTDAIGDLYIGDFMEYEKTADGWLYSDGKEVTGLDKAIADIKLSDMLSGNVSIEDSLNGVTIGELLGYKKEGSNWLDKNGVPLLKESLEDKIFYQLYDKTVQDFTDGNITMTDLMDGIYLGEFLGLENKGGTWYEKDTETKASVLYQTIAGLTINELMDNSNALTDAIGELYFGDFMEYEKTADGWLDADGNEVTGLDKTLADIKISDMLNGTVDVQDSVNGVQIGELLGYTHNGSTWVDENNVPIPLETMEDRIFSQIYDKTMQDFSDGNITMSELMDGIYLGEFLGLENRAGTWYEKGTNVKASVLYGALADITMPELLNDGSLITTELKTLYMGDFMGYVYRGNAWYEADGVTLLGGVDKVIAEISLADVLDGTINIKDSIKDVSIGELLGYENKFGVWYDGETAIGKDDITGKVFYGIYGKTVSEFGSLEIEDLMEGIYLGEFLGLENRDGAWYEKGTNVKASVLYSTIADIEIPDLLDNGNLITDRLKVLYVGDFMGFVNKNGTWYEANGVNALKGADKLMAEISLGDVLNGTLSLDINSLKLEDLINPNGNKVLEFLCSGGTTINGLSGKIDTMVLGDVVDTSNNTMLGLLADTKLDDLSTKINSLYVGEIMGFTKCTQNASCEVHGDCSACTEDENCHIHGVDCAEGELFWYEKSGANWVLEVGVEGRVADLTVDSIGHHGIKELNFVLGDVMTEQQLSESLFELAYTGEIKNADNSVKYKAVADVNHIPITQLAERIGVGAETASYLQLEHANLLHLEEDVEVKLDAIFGVKVVNGETIGVWEEWTVNKIFTELVNKIALLG